MRKFVANRQLPLTFWQFAQKSMETVPSPKKLPARRLDGKARIYALSVKKF